MLKHRFRDWERHLESFPFTSIHGANRILGNLSAKPPRSGTVFYSSKRRGVYLIASPVRRLFEGGAYLKDSYHKDKTFWLYNLIYFMSIFQGLQAWRTEELEDFRERTEWKERRDILTLSWKTSLLMKINSHCWLRVALQRSQCIFIILWKYSNKGRTVAVALIRGRSSLTFPVLVRRLIEGGAYSSNYGTSIHWSWINFPSCAWEMFAQFVIIQS